MYVKWTPDYFIIQVSHQHKKKSYPESNHHENGNNQRWKHSKTFEGSLGLQFTSYVVIIFLNFTINRSNKVDLFCRISVVKILENRQN